MKRNGFLCCVALLAAMATTFAGCKKEGDSSSSSSASAGGKPRVALVMKSLANEFFSTMQAGAEAHQKAHTGDYDLVTTGIKNETDVDNQISQVEQMIAQHVQAIVLAPADSKALVPVCKKAADAGIVVVNIDNKLDVDALKEKNLQVAFVGPNNMTGAKLAGDFLAKKLTKGDAVVLIDGEPGAFNAIQRHDGFAAAMTGAGMTIVTSQSAHWEMEKATPLVASILNSHPEIKAVLCGNDSMCLGAHTALKDSSKLGKVMLVGFDNIPAVQDLIRNGDVLCTADQHGDQIAVKGIEYALQIIKDHSAPKDQETAVDLVTADTLKK